MPILGRKTCRVEAAEEEMSREKCRRPLPSSAGFTLLRKPYENMYIYWKCENAENRSDIDPISTSLKAKVGRDRDSYNKTFTAHLAHPNPMGNQSIGVHCFRQSAYAGG